MKSIIELAEECGNVECLGDPDFYIKFNEVGLQQFVDKLQHLNLVEIKELKEKYDINEASNKAVELALEDVPYKGSYAEGIEYLKQLQREKDGFELFGYIEPRKNFEPMEAEAVYIVGEKDFDGCTVALYRRKE